MKKKSTFVLFVFLFMTYSIHSQNITTVTQGQDQLNSILGVKLGMLKEEVIAYLKEQKMDYEEYSVTNEVEFQYDLLQDGREKNRIKVFFTSEKVSEIYVLFYKYNMANPIGAYSSEKRFQKYLTELDEIYNNDINWKGKWKSKDGQIFVKTDMLTIIDIVYDVLIIRQILPKVKVHD